MVDDFKKCFFIIITSLTISSCSDNDCDNISGIWSIKDIRVNGKDFLPYLYINTFGFHCENKSAWFHASSLFEEDKNAKWKFLESNGDIDSLSINSKIKIYNNTFKIQIEKIESTNQFHLILTSKSVYISAYKIVEDY